MNRAGLTKESIHHIHWRDAYCPTCRVRMRPFHIYCPFCDTRVWSIKLILAVSAAAFVLFWIFLSLLLS